MFVCLCLFVCVCLFACLLACLVVWLFVWLFVCLCVCVRARVWVCGCVGVSDSGFRLSVKMALHALHVQCASGAALKLGLGSLADSNLNTSA